MKISRFFSVGCNAAIVLLGLVMVSAAHAANPPAKAATAAAKTNAAPSEVTIPLSVFSLATKPAKDPFFPLSQRQPFPVTNSAPSFSAALFLLKGVSGPPTHRLAIVNNRTVAAGEDAEITTTSGKIIIHCLEVRDTAVVLRAGGHPEVLEIALRASAR